jgi:hypothetical protein
MTSRGSTKNIPPVMNIFPSVTLHVGVTSATCLILARKLLTFAGKILKVHIMLNKSPTRKNSVEITYVQYLGHLNPATYFYFKK